MSLNQVFDNIGNVIAPAVGGALLVLTAGVYGAIGLALGIMTIAGPPPSSSLQKTQTDLNPRTLQSQACVLMRRRHRAFP